MIATVRARITSPELRELRAILRRLRALQDRRIIQPRRIGRLPRLRSALPCSALDARREHRLMQRGQFLLPRLDLPRRAIEVLACDGQKAPGIVDLDVTLAPIRPRNRADEKDTQPRSRW